MKLKTFKEILTEATWGQKIGDYKEYSIRISNHLNVPRKNSSKPRHTNMPHDDIVDTIRKGFPNIDNSYPFLITFPYKDYYGALVGILVKNTIRVITMIIQKSNKTPEKIQPKRTNRYHIKG